MNNENIDITTVCGDILEVYFCFEGIERENIASVFFTCAEQDIQVELPYSEEEEGYRLRLESTATSELKPCVSRYDLTVRFTDENDFTAVYNGIFNALEKFNKVV